MISKNLKTQIEITINEADFNDYAIIENLTEDDVNGIPPFSVLINIFNREPIPWVSPIKWIEYHLKIKALKMTLFLIKPGGINFLFSSNINRLHYERKEYKKYLKK